MLRYKRISQHFFMDTFFATKGKGKSSRPYVHAAISSEGLANPVERRD
jgi:hypothetical protein